MRRSPFQSMNDELWAYGELGAGFKSRVCGHIAQICGLHAVSSPNKKSTPFWHFFPSAAMLLTILLAVGFVWAAGIPAGVSDHTPDVVMPFMIHVGKRSHKVEWTEGHAEGLESSEPSSMLTAASAQLTRTGEPSKPSSMLAAASARPTGTGGPSSEVPVPKRHCCI